MSVCRKQQKKHAPQVPHEVPDVHQRLQIPPLHLHFQRWQWVTLGGGVVELVELFLEPVREVAAGEDEALWRICGRGW